MNLSNNVTAIHLSKSLKDLLEILGDEYNPLPADPNKELSSVAVNVVFLCRCLLVEMLNSVDLRGTSAIYLSIATGDYEAFRILVKMEIDDLKENQPNMLIGFKEKMQDAVRDRKFGPAWEKAIVDA